ncbi:MAG: DUF916 domain-containing protein [Firmicutes bacterium]|nr:DUF916 domain-containing protein [Bacillota bacterium]
MRHTRITWSAIFICLTVFGLFIGGEVCAQSPNLSFDPLLIERSVRAGETLNYSISIQNESMFEPITLELNPCDITEDISGTYRLVPAGTTSYSLAAWTQVEPQVITIPPGHERSIDVNVSIPRGTSGGRYGAVAIAPKEGGSTSLMGQTVQAPFKFQMASFMELEISGGAARRESFISDLNVRPSAELPSVRQQVGDEAVVYSAEVTNAGNIHIIARGNLVIQTEDGRTVARYPMGGGKGLILPETTVALRSVTRPNLPPGNYRAKAVVDYGGSRPAVADIGFTVTESYVEGKIEEGKTLSRLVVEPAELDIQAKAGAFSSSILELANRGDEPIEVKSKIIPLAFSETGEFLPEEERGTAPGWVEVSPADFALEPGRSRRVRLSMRPPKDADGGYYYDLIFRSAGADAAVESGTNVLLFVGSEVVKDGRLEITDLKGGVDAATVDAVFTNLGNYHVNIMVDFILWRVHPQYEEEETGRIIPRQTETITFISLPMDTAPVLPGTVRKLSFQIPADLEPAEYEMAIRVDYGGEEPVIEGLIFSVEGGSDTGD